MKHLMTVAILVAAITAMSAGYTTGFALLLIAGVFLEGVFWLRLFKKHKPSPTQP